MTETDEHPASLSPGPSVERPKRAATFVGRLSQALRDQNWTAVAIELGIVVLGVIIGFQVAAWGQARTDRAKEQAFLHQLASDLRATQQLLTETDEFSARSHLALDRLIETFGQSERPPRDSILRWVQQGDRTRVTRPVLGTAEALVATGNLALIRDDSLRITVTALSAKFT